MKLYFHLLTIVLSLLTSACNSGKPSTPVVDVEAKGTDSTNISADFSSEKSDPQKFETQVQEATEEEPESDCVRGQAEPIVKRSVFPKTTFTLRPDKLTAIETVDLPSGDKLIIKNIGCEYYTLAFRFETSRFDADTNDIYFWSKKAIELVKSILKGIDEPVEVDKGLKSFEKHVEVVKSELKLLEEVDYGGDEIRSIVSLHQIEKISDRKYAVEIWFAVGPL